MISSSTRVEPAPPGFVDGTGQPCQTAAADRGDLAEGARAGSAGADTGGMTRTEQIRKARHDVDLLQEGLQKVSTVLEGAEEVAVLGERARRRAPVVLVVAAGAGLLAVGVVLLVRRRRHRQEPDETA